MNKEKIAGVLKNTVAIIVMIALFIIIFYQNRDRDLFKTGKDEAADVIEEFSESDSSQNYLNGQVARLGENVAYLTTSSLKILDKNAGGAAFAIGLAEPMLHAEGDYAACYGRGSYDITVYRQKNECYSLTLDNKIIRAKVNKNGYLLVVTEKEGYNCECRVYNRKGEAIFKWDISKSEFLDGDINNSNNAIAISVAAAGKEKLVGEVMLIDITGAEILCKNDFDSQLLFSLDFNRNDTFIAFGDKNVVYFNADGSSKWTYDFGGQSLLKADTTDPDMTVLAFSAQGSGIKGNSTDVRIINRLGKVTAEKKFDSVADDISVGENTVAIAFGKSVYITDGGLKVKKEIKADSSIRKIALYSDNKHLFVIGNTGGKILQ